MQHCNRYGRGPMARAVRSSLFVTVAMTAMFRAVGALAQTAAPAAAAPQTVGEVVVTAQRRQERLQDVPIAITAYSGRALERMGVSGSKELSQVTPGLNFTQSVYSPQPTIRGIGTRGVGAGDESIVPIYIDGVYQPFIPASDLQFNNIERVEVLKGPQGALFGRNATGGAINIITRQPTETPTGDFSLSYGSYNETDAKAYISGGSGPIAANLAVVANRSDGYIKDVLSGAKYGGEGDFSARGKLLITPSNRVDLTFALSTTNNADSTGEGYQVLNGDSIARRYNAGVLLPSAPYETALSYKPYNKAQQLAGSVTANVSFDAFNLTFLTGVQSDSFSSRADSDASPLAIADTQSTQTSRNLYEELYAVSKGDSRFSWIVGEVYYHDLSARPTDTYQTSLTNVLSETTVSSSVGTDSYAAYAQGDYKITDAWSVSLGGRYTYEEKSINGNVISTTHLIFEKSASFSKFTPTLTLKYKPIDQLNFYAKAGQAFKSGIFNSQATSAATSGPVLPETVTQYEIGAKVRPTSTFSLDISAYATDYKNLQSNTRDPVTLVSIIQNAGSAKIYGGEIQATVRPINGLNLYAGIGLLHGYYDVFPAAQVTVPNIIGGLPSGNNTIYIDAHGKTLIRAPSVTASAGGDYQIPVEVGELVLSGNIYYEGKSYWDILNRLEQHPYTLVNGELSWRLPDKRYKVAVWGKNLLDANYDLTVVTSSAADSHVFAPRRTVGVRLEYGF